MREVTHRGYAIRYQLKLNRWSAHVLRPGGFMVMRDGFITATVDEGEEVLLRRALARIDEELRQRGNPLLQLDD